MSRNSCDTGAQKTNMWKSGESYQYPIPKPDGNPWEVVLQALLKKDKVQCDAWKDEVQNLLIFVSAVLLFFLYTFLITDVEAGLFSAVVTSFVVQSYQSLLPSSNDLTVALLARIVAQLEGTSNTTLPGSSTTVQTLLGISPISSSDIRVNTFWFLSLVLSLTTVLVGIVSLQWLREHQNYSDSLSPRVALGIFHMRTEALEKWYVPQIFAMLPLLLQAALILFFAGVIDFLMTLSTKVAVPVAVFVGLTVCFLLATTLLPTLQCFMVSIRQPGSNTPIPSQCPYKSPQSLAFRRLATLSSRIFTAVHGFVIQFIYLTTIKLPSLVFRLLRRPCVRPEDTWKQRLLSYRAYLFWASQHWLDFDRTWLVLRNEHFDITRPRVPGDKSTQTLLEPIYDPIRALGSAVHGNEHHESILFASYHCFQDISHSAKDVGDYPDQHIQACYRDLVPTWNSPIANIASIVVDPTFELLHDIHTVLFLRLPGVFYKAINPAHVFGKHMLELHTRILGDLYAFQPRKLSQSTAMGPTGFFHWYAINMSTLDFDTQLEDAFFEQFFMIFHSFILNTIELEDRKMLLNTFHTHSDLDDFISLAAYLTWRSAEKALGDKQTEDANGSLCLLISTLNLIDTMLTKTMTSDRGSTEISDFLFCCSSLYLKRAWQERPPTLSVTTPTEKRIFEQMTRLSRILSGFHTNVLLPYELQMDETQFIRTYGSFVHEGSLPKNFFDHRHSFSVFAEGKLEDETDVPLPVGFEGEKVREAGEKHDDSDRRRLAPLEEKTVTDFNVFADNLV